MSLMHRVASRAAALIVAAAMASAMLVAANPPEARAEGARRVSAWLPWWDQARGYESFEANADLYDQLSPFWYEMLSATRLARFPGAEDASIIEGVKANGVPLIPTISNEFDGARVSTMLATASDRSAHVSLLVDLAKRRGYDGLDIDYENLPASDRDRFSAFISELATAMHTAGKVLTVAVHPKTSEPGSWNGPQAQDYAAIGAAADRVRVMAYDYHWSTSPAGPVAPVGWVDQVAAFAASVIPPAKIQLGMPLYGYDWVDSTGEGVTHEIAASRMKTHGATRQWSQTDAAPWFSYKANGVDHTVWYEDAGSVAAKLPIVDRYGLAGAVFWRLGGEDPAVWPVVRKAWGSTSDGTNLDIVPPSAPTGVTATGLRRKVKLTWNGSTDEGGSGLADYLVYRSASQAGPYAHVGTTASTSYTSPGLKPKTPYWFYVVARDGAGNTSVPSTAVSATTK